MCEIFIGTDKGIWRLVNKGENLQPEEGPQNAAFLAAAGGKLWALTPEKALWVRTDGLWQVVNQQPVKEEVWSFAADANVDDRLYLGVSPALLYRSDDGGKTWVANESIRRIPGYETWTFPPPPHIPHVRFIAPDPQQPGAVYIGVEEGGVYRSDDGERWESLNEGLYWDVHTVLPSPDSSQLYATTGNGFYRSDDGGHHWRHIRTGLERSYAVPCVVSPVRSHLLYTAAAATPPPGWKNGANAAIYRSDDGGENWVQLHRGLPPKFDAMVRSLIVDEAGDVYAAAGNQLFASFDDGENWQLLAGDLPTVKALASW